MSITIITIVIMIIIIIAHIYSGLPNNVNGRKMAYEGRDANEDVGIRHKNTMDILYTSTSDNILHMRRRINNKEKTTYQYFIIIIIITISI